MPARGVSCALQDGAWLECQDRRWGIDIGYGLGSDRLVLATDDLQLRVPDPVPGRGPRSSRRARAPIALSPRSFSRKHAPQTVSGKEIPSGAGSEQSAIGC